MTNYVVDALQYANWSEKIFREMREGGVDAVHVTIAYHETFREMVLAIESWNTWFETGGEAVSALVTSVATPPFATGVNSSSGPR